LAAFQPTEIQIHLTNGRKHLFYQGDADLVAKICDDLDLQVFTRQNLIIANGDHVTAFPGHAMLGITVLTDPLPPSFYERELQSKTVITQIGAKAFEAKRQQLSAQVEGQ